LEVYAEFLHKSLVRWCLALAEDLGDTRSGGSDPPKWRSS
jgi:hypothetical protein